MLTRPSFGLAEVAWRWSFGAAVSLLLGFAFLEYLDTLPVRNADLFLLRTAQPVLISQAVRHIFKGSAFRLIEAAAVLILALGVGWVIVSSLARAATIKALLAQFRETAENRNWRLWPLLTLNGFRLGTTLAAVVGLLAAFLLGGAVSRPAHPAPGSAFLIVLAIAMLVWISWSMLNWFLSLAGIFVVAEGETTFRAITATVDLCRTRAASVFAAGTWFGLAHLTAFVVATSVVAFPLGFASVLPASVVLGGVLLVTLLYFAIADFLYIGRLAAYVAILRLPDVPAIADAMPTPLLTLSGAGHQSSSGVDPTELILSDAPANK